MTKKLGDLVNREDACDKSSKEPKFSPISYGIAFGALLFTALILSFPHYKAKKNNYIIIPQQKTLQEEFQLAVEELTEDPKNAKKLQVGEKVSLSDNKQTTAEITGFSTASEKRPSCYIYLEVKGEKFRVLVPGKCPQPN